MKTPTVGRVVLVLSNLWPGEVRPAFITKVWSPTCVNLHVQIDRAEYEQIQRTRRDYAQVCLPTSVTLFEEQSEAETVLPQGVPEGQHWFRAFWPEVPRS